MLSTSGGKPSFLTCSFLLAQGFLRELEQKQIRKLDEREKSATKQRTSQEEGLAAAA
ncbi:MAG TPA: hypothetical protein VLB46_17675 [Pyrinomonadaceae bacterium]|nr:hypothetical protein [Pyrinomonadaceae bacterium]